MSRSRSALRQPVRGSGVRPHDECERSHTNRRSRVMSTPTASDLIKKVLDLEPLISELSDEAETDRRLSGRVYQALYDAGLFGMVVPRAQGGLEFHPTETMEVWEAIARIDSAAAWNLVMTSTISLFAAWSRGDFRKWHPDRCRSLESSSRSPQGRRRLENLGAGALRERMPSRSMASDASRRDGRRRAKTRPLHGRTGSNGGVLSPQ